ncbi:MAG: hypothetical protein IPP49_12185 [Saprospiraceae bacterium]|nr:hypothetical protein [Saprospiraceae bacterium]
MYIEPEKVISINHEVYNLYAERRHEIYKILRALCAFIRPYADSLLVVQHTLVRIDTIRGKAKLHFGSMQENHTCSKNRYSVLKQLTILFWC